MLAFVDWTSWATYHYLAVAGGVVVVLAIGLYMVPGGKMKVPSIALSNVGSLGLGLALGVILMGMLGYEPKKADSEGGAAPPGGGGPPAGMMPPMGRGGGRGPAPANYRQQLATLVSKLDVLTEKPLTVKLSDDQRKEVQEQLKGLADADELTDGDAHERFEKLHEALKDQTATLEAAGYRWPGEGGGGGGERGGGGGGRGGGAGAPEPPTNPFKSEPNSKHLKDLNARLEK
jgi:hypothetical protein